MITGKSASPNYRTLISDGVNEMYADTLPEHGGGGAGFRPSDLLEAAVAGCVNMVARIYADKRGIPLTGVTTRVSLDRSQPDEAVFTYSVELEGDLTPEQREGILRAAAACPVKKTLQRKIRFETAKG